jgi:hypothetical protein
MTGIAFPRTGSDQSFGGGVNPVTIAPPANVADGDFLVAAVTGRTALPTSLPGSWATVVASYTTQGGIGLGMVQVLPVPSASGLPANWTWTWASTTRQTVTIQRVTGVNLASAVAGTATGQNPASNSVLPVPSAVSGGGCIEICFSYFNEFDIATCNDPAGNSSGGQPQALLSNTGLTGSNRVTVIMAGGADNGAGASSAYTINCQTQWLIGAPGANDAASAVLGLNAASAPAVTSRLLMAAIV